VAALARGGMRIAGTKVASMRVTLPVGRARILRAPLCIPRSFL